MGLVSRSVTDHNREILTATNCEKNTRFSHRDDVANHILTWLQHIPTASGLDQTQNRQHKSPEHNNTGRKSTIDGSDRDQNMMLHEDNGRISNRWLRFEEWTSLESSLASGHPFNALISSIILRALDGFTQWSVARNGWHNTRRDNDYQEREQASQSEVPFKKNGVLEFACPYYKKNPSRYAECLKRCRLKTVNDVKNHLWQNHRIPFYCPVCKREFSTASGRDQHIVKRLCALEDVFPFEGVSDDQKRQLFRRHKNFGERKQWFQIWKLLLPKEPTPKSGHLDATHGLEVSRFRDFWSLHGDMTISKAVEEANLADWDQRNEERDLACLYTEVLYGAIEKIMARLDVI
ncbi:hypothetical protein K456DRAFT_1720240 [Colletotrichum gloeosporioides 23]|nr:hypothetical protein K456DRAFT_1720240 [Colletotrichum gloeosporioides 23]